MPAQAPSPEILFEALIRPHRSLSRRGLAILIGAILGLSVTTSTLFWLLGAWPVAGFSGVEVTAATLLLWVNARAARESEWLALAPPVLRIVRTDARGRRDESILDPSWLRVIVQERPGRVPALLLTTSGRQEEVAARLGEEEKRDLGRALEAAIWQWRHPTFDHSNPQWG